MPRNDSGVFSLSGQFAVPFGIPNSATINGYIGDIGDELTNSLDRDGKSTLRANLKAGGFKITGLGNGTAATDAVAYGQLTNATSGYGNLAGANVWTGVNTFEKSDDGATIGPELFLRRNSASPAVDDVIGGIQFQGRDSIPTVPPADPDYTTYAGIEARILNPVEAAQDGALAFRTRKTNVDATRLIVKEGLYTALATGGDKGPDTINTQAYYQAGNRGTVLPRGWIDGLTLSNDPGDVVNDIAIASGQCTSDDGTYVMDYPTALVKRLDSTWAVGTGVGGLDTGGETATTWYHVFAIARTDTNVCDVLFSTSPGSPTMPANYTKKRRIGSIFNDAASALRPFTQNGDEFLWNDAVIDLDAANPGITAVTRTLSVPTGVQVQALLSVGGYQGTSAFSIFMSSLDSNDQTPQAVGTAALTGFMTGNTTASNWNFSPIAVRTNTAAQVRSRISAGGAANRLGIITRGWIDRRGRT